jgi:hypothetical protein
MEALLPLNQARSNLSDATRLRLGERTDTSPRTAEALPMTHKRLLERIRTASSAEQIDELLAEGETFEKATDRTRNRWRKKAAQRRREIGISADTCE